MRRLGVWGVGAAGLIVLGLAAGARAGELPPWGGKPATARPAGGPAKGKPPAAEPVRSSAEEFAAARKREEAAYLRRVSVCDKLTQIAYQSNDASLQDLAEQLQQRAFDVYMQRVAHLPSGQSDGTTDEQILRQLQDPSAGARLEDRGQKAKGPQSARAGGWFGRGR